MLADEYTTCTDEGGQPFPSAWVCITAPLPYGRGCDLDNLHASVALLATQLETAEGHSQDPHRHADAGQVTKRLQVLEVLPTLKAPFTAPQVAAKTGLTTTQARHVLERLTKAKSVVKVSWEARRVPARQKALREPPC